MSAGGKKAWFEVDREGLRQVLAQKDPAFILFELLQNAWDNPGTTQVDVSIKDGSREVSIEVADDNPDGFRNLEEAHTLFSPSAKKSDPTRRGRFNLGEKLVLACCKNASIASTTGTVVFNEHGRRRYRWVRPSGTAFRGTLRAGITTAAHLRSRARLVIPPIRTTLDGELLKVPPLVATVEASLPTIVAKPLGDLAAVTRSTQVNVYRAETGEGLLYEMGLPICANGLPYHTDVQQKVPLGLDRDAPREKYLEQLRAVVLNVVSADLSDDVIREGWVTRALESPRCEASTVVAVVKRRFGSKTTAFDVNDPEANKRAVAAGYTVLAGGTFGRSAWEKIREAKIAPASGQLFPTPKPFHPDGRPLKVIPPSEWTIQERGALGQLTELAERIVQHRVTITLADDPTWRFNAAYAPGALTINRACVGSDLVTPLNEDILDLLLHELGHEQSGDHLSAEYYRALTRYGARLALLLAREPQLIGAVEGVPS